jgi:hypothetical protein
MTKTWHDRVVERLRALQARDDADKDTYRYLCTYMSNAQANHDGEKLARDGGETTKLYKGEPVFSFSVNKGEIIVRPVGQKPESYADREHALDRMADLMAQAAHDPQWGVSGESLQRVAPKPLYPV